MKKVLMAGVVLMVLGYLVHSSGNTQSEKPDASVTQTITVVNKPWEGCDRGLDIIKQDVSNGLGLFGKGFTHFLSPDGSKLFEAGVIANQQSIKDAKDGPARCQPKFFGLKCSKQLSVAMPFKSGEEWNGNANGRIPGTRNKRTQEILDLLKSRGDKDPL